ncbi:MAG TPA: hypothetical protein DCP92_10485 [Nitrospiraceae bacterium]|nr:hypothetical protein [Nitrospiraceae bacterium]
MALEGSLSDFGLADILQLIYFQKKTGVLTLTGGKDKVLLMFSDGNIVSAESRRRTEENRLGMILIKKNLIEEAALRAALEEQKATGLRIGDILMNKGLVGIEDLKATLVSQVTETVVQLFSWKEGTYEFQSHLVVVNKDMPITLDTQHLLMDGLRIVDEWSLIEGKITLDTVFEKNDTTDVSLTPDEERLLTFIDGESDVSIIIDLSGMADFEASRTLVSLMERNVIKPVEVSPVTKVTITDQAEARERSFMKWLPSSTLIIALVISFLAPTIWGSRSSITFEPFPGGDELRRLEAVREIDALRFKAEAYKYSNGFYPRDLDQVGSSKDPWGRPYFYRAETDGVTIISVGPDGKMGTADDVY